MIRNLKVMGLALVAMLAMSAVVSSVASAASAKFTAAGVPAGVKAGAHGNQIGAGDTFTIGTTTLTCAEVTYTGEAGETGPASSTVTLNPKYGTCHIIAPLIGTRTVTVVTNGCSYKFTATKNTNSAGPTPGILTPFSADLQIICPGKPIEVHIYNSSNHNAPHGPVLCTYDIGNQTINNQIRLTNIAAPASDIVAHVHATVAVTNTIPGGICTNATTATYKGEDTITATNGAANVATSVS